MKPVMLKRTLQWIALVLVIATVLLIVGIGRKSAVAPYLDTQKQLQSDN